MRALVYGNLTLDKNISRGIKYDGPGGSAFFVAKTIGNLGGRVKVVSPYGKDFPKEMLKDIDLFPPHPTGNNTLVFHNFINNGDRKQSVEHLECSGSIDISKLHHTGTDLYDFLFFCPVVDNLKTEQVVEIKNHISKKIPILLIAQGLFRRVGESGKISNTTGDQLDAFLALVDIITLSEKDTDRPLEKAAHWSEKGPIIIVTQAQNGCTVFSKGIGKKFPAYENKYIIDETGAGDIFSAAFLWAYFEKNDIDYAADFANAAASLSLSYHSQNLQITPSEIRKLIKG